jgi:hypothetical protein
MPVSFDAFFSELILKSEFDCLFQDFIIDWNPVISNDDSIGEIDCWGWDIPPSVFSDLINIKSFSGVSVQDVGQHVFWVFRQELRHFVFAGQYFLVQFGGLRILKRQASAQHGIEDDTAAPNVNHDSFVTIFSLNHFRSSVARWSARGFKLFIFSVGIWKTKIDDSDSFIIVNQ